MKRYRQFFAFLFICFLFIFANTSLLYAQDVILRDLRAIIVSGGGGATGEVIIPNTVVRFEVSCIPADNADLIDTAWVYSSAIGQGDIRLNRENNTGVFSGEMTATPALFGRVNGEAIPFDYEYRVRDFGAVDGTNRVLLMVDVVAPEPGEPIISPTSPPIIDNDNPQLVIRVPDNAYQTSPSTTASIDLTPLGGLSNHAMTWNSTRNAFEIVINKDQNPYSWLRGKNIPNAACTITLRDPYNQTATVQTQPITVSTPTGGLMSNALVTAEPNRNGAAIIGSTLNFSVEFTRPASDNNEYQIFVAGVPELNINDTRLNQSGGIGNVWRGTAGPLTARNTTEANLKNFSFTYRLMRNETPVTASNLTAALLVDAVLPGPLAANLSNNTIDGNNRTLTITVTDPMVQTTSTATLDASPFGGSGNMTMERTTSGYTLTLNADTMPWLNGKNQTSNCTITVSDGYNNSVTTTTGDITVNTTEATVQDAQVFIRTAGGNEFASQGGVVYPGSLLSFRTAVQETPEQTAVTVSLSNAAALGLQTTYNLTRTGNNFRADTQPLATTGQQGTCTATFRYNKNGVISTREVTFRYDLRPTAPTNVTLDVLCNNAPSSLTSGGNRIATDTCVIRVRATIPRQDGDQVTMTLNVPQDLAGGNNTVQMQENPANSGTFTGTFTVPAGTLNDQLFSPETANGFTIDYSRGQGADAIQGTVPVPRGVYVDSQGPTINQVEITSTAGNYAVVGDRITIRAQVTNVEDGQPGSSVVVNLASLGMGLPDEKTMILETAGVNGAPSTYTYSFIVQGPQNPVQPVSREMSFPVIARDPIREFTAHTVTAQTPPFFIDNQVININARVYTTPPSSSTPNVPSNIASTTCRIVFNVKHQPLLASNNDMAFTVNMTPVNGDQNTPIPPRGEMGGQMTYEYVYTVPEENGLSIEDFTDLTFYGNYTRTVNGEEIRRNFTFTNPDGPIKIDNIRPKDQNRTTVTIVNEQDNSNLLIGTTFRVKVEVEGVEQGKVLLDLRQLGQTGPVEGCFEFTKESENVYTCTQTIEDSDLIPAVIPFEGVTRFPIHINDTIIDSGGNIRRAHTLELVTPQVTVDNVKPKITELNARIIRPVTVSGIEIANLNSTIEITTTVTDNDGIFPTVNMANIGYQNVNFSPNQAVPGSSFIVRTPLIDGELNDYPGGTPCNWEVFIMDKHGNKNKKTTSPYLNIDNVRPLVDGNLQVTIADQPVQNIIIGDVVDFKLTLPEELSTPKATIDFSHFGGSPAHPMNWDSSNKVFTLSYTFSEHDAELTAFRFKAIVEDEAKNTLNKDSHPINIDLFSPKFIAAETGMAIYERAADGSSPDLCGQGDKLICYAKLAKGESTATLEAMFEIEPGRYLSKPMQWNSSKNHYEAFITVQKPGYSEEGLTWKTFDTESLHYIINVKDLMGNNGLPHDTDSVFKIKNTLPGLVNYTLTILPDNPKIGVYNTNGTESDRLRVYVELDPSDTILSATLDLSATEGYPNDIQLTGISGYRLTHPDIDLSPYPPVNLRNAPATVRITDALGQNLAKTITFPLDNKSPEISAVKFDGKILTAEFDEPIANTSDLALFKLIGRLPNNNSASIDLGSSDIAALSVLSETVLQAQLTLEGEKAISSWTTAPLKLELKTPSSFAGEIKDINGNWLKLQSSWNVQVTDDTWLKPVEITKLELLQNWPYDMSIRFEFDRPMDPATLTRQDIVFFTATSIPSVITAPDYSVYYLLQNGTEPENKDEAVWSEEDKVLTITISTTGRDWFASNLGYKTSEHVKFAHRNNNMTLLAKAKTGKSMKYYSPLSPVRADDNRFTNPPPALSVYPSTANRPVVDLSKGTLEINFVDRALLFEPNFQAKDPSIPTLAVPEALTPYGINEFTDKIYIHEVRSGRQFLCEFEDISDDYDPTDGVTDNIYASTKARLKFTPANLESFMTFYSASPAPLWKIKIKEGAFIDMWRRPNPAYFSVAPGDLIIKQVQPDALPQLLACAVSDEPPTKEDPQKLRIIAEYSYGRAGEIFLPFDENHKPVMTVDTQGFSPLMSLVYESSKDRVVNGLKRRQFTYKASLPFAGEVDGVLGTIKMEPVKDIFGNYSPSYQSNKVFNIAKQSNSSPSGYLEVARDFIIDNTLPTVTNTEPVLIGQVPAGSKIFKVTFSETMSPDINPTASLEMGLNRIALIFDGWENDQTTAVFRNSEPVIKNTPNGNWYWNISMGEDMATNRMLIDRTRMLSINTNRPQVLPDSVHLMSRQDLISSEYLLDTPFSFSASNKPGSLKVNFTYAEMPESLPHMLIFFDESNQRELAKLPVSIIDGIQAEIIFKQSDFIPTTPQTCNIGLKLIDQASNESDNIRTIKLNSVPPAVTRFELMNAMQDTTGRYHWKPSENTLIADVDSSNAYERGLKVVLAKIIGNEGQTATNTFLMQPGSYGNYKGSFPTDLEDGDYVIRIADLAGNFHTGAANLNLSVDSVKPTVISISPGASDFIPEAAAESISFKVTFSEAIDKLPERQPVLNLATQTMNYYNEIPMVFRNWDAEGKVAEFVNINAISPDLNAGKYSYSIKGAYDLAGNLMDEIDSSNSPFQVNVYSKGPVADCNIITKQPHIYGSEKDLYNVPFNPNLNPNTRITLDYRTEPYHTPHSLLILNEAEQILAELPVSITGTIGEVAFPATPPYAYDHSYSLKIRNNLGTIGPELAHKAIVDKTASALSAPPLLKIGEKQLTQDPEDGYLYAPLNGDMSFLIILNNETEHKLILKNTEPPANLYEVFLEPGQNRTHTKTFGSDLPEGSYLVDIYDLAGNKVTPAGSTFKLLSDRTKPLITQLTVSDAQGNPLEAAGLKGYFTAVFSEPMDTTRDPKLLISALNENENEVTAEPVFAGWLSTNSALFTTGGCFDDGKFPAGTAKLILTEAYDRAGNENEPKDDATATIYARKPLFLANLYSSQYIVTKPIMADDYTYKNAHFSPYVKPNEGLLLIDYKEGPYALPHFVRLFEGGTQVATAPIVYIPEKNQYSAIVNSDFFFMPDGTNPGQTEKEYSFRVADSLGNVAISPLSILYDGRAPKVNHHAVNKVSEARFEKHYFYNPNSLDSVEIHLTANTSNDMQLLLAKMADEIPIATTSHKLNLTAGKFVYSGTLVNSFGQSPEDGLYKAYAADWAGNAAINEEDDSVFNFSITIDRLPPFVKQITKTLPASPDYVTTCNQGELEIEVKFNESLHTAKMPTLSLATTTADIPMEFVAYKDSDMKQDTAVFRNKQAITNKVLQGRYSYKVSAWDMTGNPMPEQTEPGYSLLIQSKGPVAKKLEIVSTQPHLYGSQELLDKPVSFSEGGKTATIKAEFQTADPNGRFIQLYQNSDLVYSAPLAMTPDGLKGTATIDFTSGLPIDQDTSYRIYLVDSDNNLSIEHYSLRIDSVKPVPADIEFRGGSDLRAERTVYLNPDINPGFEISFTGLEDTAPVLIVSDNAVPPALNIYPLQKSDRVWKYNFRALSNTEQPLPDGNYNIMLADEAGNLAEHPDIPDNNYFYNLVIDKTPPVITEMNVTSDSEAAASGYFAPGTGNSLSIEVVTPDPLFELGSIQGVDVITQSGQIVATLPVPLNSMPGSFTVTWNGLDENGMPYPDGNYTFKVKDTAGNYNNQFTYQIYLVSETFKFTGLAQKSPAQLEAVFNQQPDLTTFALPGAVTISPNIGIDSIVADDSSLNKAIINLAQEMQHGITYKVTVIGGKSIYGSSADANYKSRNIMANTEKPRVLAYNFDSLAGNNTVRFVFSKPISETSANNPGNSSIVDAAGTPVPISTAALDSNSMSLLITTFSPLQEGNTYKFKYQNIKDMLGNPSSNEPFEFEGRDMTPPRLRVVCFNNPTNDKDLILFAQTNEELKPNTLPMATLEQGTRNETFAMAKVLRPLTYTYGISVTPANGRQGKITVKVTDKAGNETSREVPFSITSFAPGIRASINSPDERLNISVRENSLKTDATVKILQREFEEENTEEKEQLTEQAAAAASIRASLLPPQTAFDSSTIRLSITSADAGNLAELTPVGLAYDVGFKENAFSKDGLTAELKLPEGEEKAKTCLFIQEGVSWKFLSSEFTASDSIRVNLARPGTVALMKDFQAPKIEIDDFNKDPKTLQSARPAFTGKVFDAGSGVARVTGSINGALPFRASLQEDGIFTFRPPENLVGGRHEISFSVADNAGNITTTPAVRFQLNLPLNITDLVQYPNPAKNRLFIRIAANRDDLNDGYVKIKIYDSSGDKVVELDTVNAVKETWNSGTSSRYLYDIPWDLRNSRGRRVANGVYFARIEARDPFNPSRKIKKTLKLAVLR